MWIRLSLLRLQESPERSFYTTRNMLHGRKQSDRRSKFQGFMVKLERDRKEGHTTRIQSWVTVVSEGAKETDPARDFLLVGLFEDWFSRKRAPGLWHRRLQLSYCLSKKAGISRLNYKMLKILPIRASRRFYDALAVIWGNKDQPES